VGVKVWPSVPAACNAAIRDVQVINPNKPIASAYAGYHKQYQRLYTALKGEFKAIAAL